MNVDWAGVTDRGRVRKNNEDAFSVATLSTGEAPRLEPDAGSCAQVAGTEMLFTVSDGVGGENAGEVASRLVADRLPAVLSQFTGSAGTLPDSDARTVLERAIRETNTLLRRESAAALHLQGMAATASTVWLRNSGAIVGQVGDSRVYRYRDGTLEQLSSDHSVIGGMVRAGSLTEADAMLAPGKNVLEQALGVRDETLAPEVFETKVQPGDLLLVCSDGLVDRLENQHLEDLLRSCRGDQLTLIETAGELIERANATSGRDNITVLLIALGAEQER